MELGLAINLIAQNKETNTTEKFELCQWLFEWGLKDTILIIIEPCILNSNKYKNEFNCSLNVIQSIIDTLCNCVKNYYSKELQNSDMSATLSRNYIIDSLKILTNLDSLLKFREETSLKEFKKYRKESDIKSLNGIDLIDILIDKEKYNLTIQIIDLF